MEDSGHQRMVGILGIITRLAGVLMMGARYEKVEKGTDFRNKNSF